MMRWRTKVPPAPGVYRVVERRAPVWYCKWTGRHWCVGADTIEEAAHETMPRATPEAWALPRLRDYRSAAERAAAFDEAAWPEAWTWDEQRPRTPSAASPEAVARLLAWRRPTVE